MKNLSNYESPMLDLTSFLDVALTVLVFFMLIVPETEKHRMKAKVEDQYQKKELVVELEGEKIFVGGQSVERSKVLIFLESVALKDFNGKADVTIRVLKDAVFGKVSELADLVGQSEKVGSIDLSVKES